MKKSCCVLLGVTLALLLSSCSFFSSRSAMTGAASEQATREYFSQMLFNGDGLSFEAENFLESNELRDTFLDDPLSAIRKANDYYQISNDTAYLAIAADICRQKAIHSEPEEAIRYYLSALYYIRKSTRIHLEGTDFHNAAHLQLNHYRKQLVYNDACYGLFTYLNRSDDDQIGNVKKFDQNGYVLFDAEGRKYTFNKSDYQLSLPREAIDSFLPCADYSVQALRQKNMRMGIGLPLIGVVKQPEDQSQWSDFFKAFDLFHLFTDPEKGESAPPLRTPPALTIPVTMVALFKENPDQSFSVSLQFIDTQLSETYLWQDKTFSAIDWPLALDYSTPLAYFLGNLPERNLITLMLNPNEVEDQCGLYMLEPYQPNKIPVVFVHGLMSSPNTWTQMINSLRSDPVIRKNYQFWFYYYSSGVPVPISGKKLLDALHAVQKEVCKSEAEKKNFEKMVIVGHSMGGLITRTMIQAEAHQLAEGLINGALNTEKRISWEDLRKDIPEEKREEIENIFTFEPLPIHRVIFMAVPHRGAKMAKWGIAQFGSWLITLPSSLLNMVTSLKDIFKDKYQILPELSHAATGIDNLDPDSRFMHALKDVGIKKDVIYHSIIGNKNGDNQPNGSDGVVPYDSSHLDGAASELVVQSGHSVHEKPAAIREVMRILRLHLEENK